MNDGTDVKIAFGSAWCGWFGSLVQSQNLVDDFDLVNLFFYCGKIIKFTII